MNEVLTNELTYSKAVEMGAPAELKKLSLYPRTGQVNVYGSQVFEIVIPASSKGHYFQNDQSYIQFRINNTSTVPFILDASAFSVLGKVEVFFGGSRISSVDDIGLFGNMLLDNAVSADDRSTVWSAAGCAVPAYTSGVPTALTLQADALTGVFSRRGQTITAGSFIDVALPIPAGLLSPQGLSKNLPMSQLKDDLILSITTSAVSRWGRIASGTLTAVNAEAQLFISKVVYQCSMLQLDGRVDEMIYKSLPNETFTIPATDIMHYYQNVTAGSGAVINIPARLKSVKQIFCVFSRLSASTTVHITPPVQATTFGLSADAVVPINSTGIQGASSTFVNGDGYVSSNGSVVGGITGWRLRVGGESFGIVRDAKSEARLELTKAFHKLNSSDAASSISQKDYLESAYVIAMSLESYGAGADGPFFDGLEFSNAGSVQLEVDGTFPQCVAHVWIVYDKVITIANGLLSYRE